MVQNNQEQPTTLDDSFASPSLIRHRAVLGSLDFEPEDQPEGLIEVMFLADKSTGWAMGLYEVRFVRPLTSEEWQSRNFRSALSPARPLWRPMEDAPKNGSKFLTLRRDWDRYEIVAWDTSRTEPGWYPKDRHAGWLIRDDADKTKWVWTSIPPPPTAAETEEKAT